MEKPQTIEKTSDQKWLSLLTATLFAVFAFILEEWFFTITKPSYLDVFSTTRKLNVLFQTFFLLASVCLIVLLLAYCAQLILRSKRLSRLLLWLGVLLPAGLTATTCLLIIDNFTYTLFDFGIVSAAGILRGTYGVLFIGLVTIGHRMILPWVEGGGFRYTLYRRGRQIWFGAIFLVVVPAAFLIISKNTQTLQASAPDKEDLVRLPNILLITGDGINAANLGAYGYSRNTTPNIGEISKTALIAENAYPNSAHTSGSITALLTGKAPMNTRVLFPPDILHGRDSYEHLPGILKSMGYFTAQIGDPFFVDSHSRNMLEAFDVTNDSNTQGDLLTLFTRYLPNDLAYFTYDALRRTSDRLLHIYYIRTMINPIERVDINADDMADQEKYQRLKSLLEEAPGPLFAHVHFIGTHGPQFSMPNQVFSAGQTYETQGMWNVDFYDDSILEFDHYVGQITADLKSLGMYDETILIITSDHGQQSSQLKRIPLIIRFPGGEYAGKVRQSVQLLDIAPTLLDYLGATIPEWMAGDSLMKGELPERPIIGTDAGGKIVEQDGKWVIGEDLYVPPFYQFSFISVIYCQNWYHFSLSSFQLYSGEISDSTSYCAVSEDEMERTVMRWMKEHLAENGFDISGLPK